MAFTDTDDTPVRSTSSPAIRPLLFAALFMVVGLTFLVYLGREESRLQGLEIEELDIQPLMFVDEPLKLADQTGKVVVLHFWGYWCPPCMKEYPDFAELQKHYADSASNEVVFASIASQDQSPENREELIENTQSFLDAAEIPPMPIYWDPAEYSRYKVAQLLKGRGFGYPTTLIVGKDGRVFEVFKGMTTKSELQKSIENARKKS